MAQKFEDKTLGVEMVVPTPFTGLHWATYQKMLRLHEGQGFIVAGFYATCEVVESLTLAGGDLKELGLNAPLEVVAWVARTMDGWLADRLAIPKN